MRTQHLIRRLPITWNPPANVESAPGQTKVLGVVRGCVGSRLLEWVKCMVAIELCDARHFVDGQALRLGRIAADPECAAPCFTNFGDPVVCKVRAIPSVQAGGLAHIGLLGERCAFIAVSAASDDRVSRKFLRCQLQSLRKELQALCGVGTAEFN
jgi:hypothetical protein